MGMDGEQATSRLFTVEEANELIQLIHPKVMRMREAIVRARAKMEQAGPTARRRQSAATPVAAAGNSISSLVQEARGLIQEIHSYGCLVNGPEAGLLDFPCLL